tara:strand:- start:7648 stop:8394 length:747 start_codon:yes stop_codon:yes gene_type:complete
MALNIDEVQVYKGQLLVCDDEIIPKALGVKEEKITGSAFIQGPVQIGNPDTFSEVEATLMVGPDNNDESSSPFDSLVVDGHQTINNGNLHTSNLLSCSGQACVWTASSINVQGWKGFDIEHPSKEGYRLRHICLEGPEGAIYTRGRVVNKNVIYLPDYWKDLVDYTTISVQLQPIGAHQNVIVKRVEPTQIHLQAQGGMPINCYYHVYGERTDGERLISEYEGKSPEDYPGDNSQYSIAGYHYDRRTL